GPGGSVRCGLSAALPAMHGAEDPVSQSRLLRRVCLSAGVREALRRRALRGIARRLFLGRGIGRPYAARVDSRYLRRSWRTRVTRWLPERMPGTFGGFDLPLMTAMVGALRNRPVFGSRLDR